MARRRQCRCSCKEYQQRMDHRAEVQERRLAAVETVMQRMAEEWKPPYGGEVDISTLLHNNLPRINFR
jgi:hypothetical protein